MQFFSNTFKYNIAQVPALLMTKSWSPSRKLSMAMRVIADGMAATYCRIASFSCSIVPGRRARRPVFCAPCQTLTIETCLSVGFSWGFWDVSMSVFGKYFRIFGRIALPFNCKNKRCKDETYYKLYNCCRQPQQIVLILSIPATSFGCTDRPKALKYKEYVTDDKGSRRKWCQPSVTLLWGPQKSYLIL